MERSTAEVLVKSVAIHLWFNAALCTFLFLLFAIGSMIDPPGDLAFSGGGWAVLLGVWLILIVGPSTLAFFTGRGLWRFKNWARVCMLVLTYAYGALILVYAGFVIFIFHMLKQPIPVAVYLLLCGMCVFLLTLCGAIIWLLQGNKTVKSLFVKTSLKSKKKR